MMAAPVAWPQTEGAGPPASPRDAASSDPLAGRWQQQRARGHAEALSGDWAAAAQTFSDLARDTGAPADRLAAMRALAQARRDDEAIAEGERLMTQVRALSAADRDAAISELANLHEAAGYRQRGEGLPAEAARSFERAQALDPARVRLLAEAGYARLAAGDRQAAVDRFVEALDRLPPMTQTEPSPAGRPPSEPSLRERLRREVREASRTWTMSAFQSWRPRGAAGPSGSSAAGSGAGAAGLQRDGLIAAQGGAELAWRLPEMRTEAGGRQAEVFARALWSQRGDTLTINDRSVQGGVGVRWQPLPGSAWRLTAERLVAIGDDATNDWLVRLAWGATMGDQPEPGRRAWPAGQFYVEAGRFFEGSGTTAVYAEGRLGVTAPLRSGWTLSPHAVFATRELRPDPSAESWAEAGLGVALRRAFGGTAHVADRGRFEWLIQYRVGVSGAGRQGWLFAASVLW